jgi:hypothetical protein
MLTFFRNIRRGLLGSGETLKYLKYALGEILLVVIGILLALQLNNWNAEQADRRQSREFVERLLVEVESNLRSTSREMTAKDGQLGALARILQMIGDPPGTGESRALDSLIYLVLTSSNIEIRTGTLTEGLNNGKIALIKSDSLRVALYSFSSLMEEVRTFEKLNNDDSNSSYGIYLYDNFNYRQMDAAFSPYKDALGTTAFPANNLEILKSRKFENLTDNRLFLTNRQREHYRTLARQLQRIKALIQQEVALPR